jgi:hypothetical protein
MQSASKLMGTVMLAVATSSLLLAGFFHAYPIEIFAGSERTIVLDPARHAMTPRAGLSYYCDLAQAHLDMRADNAHSCHELRVRLYEDGEPLVHEIDHRRIETQPGLYSHWDHYIAFSPHQGKPDGVYSIRYLSIDESDHILALLSSPQVWTWIAAINLLAMAIIRVVDPVRIPRYASLFLIPGLAAAIAPHIIKHWNVAETTADSQYYVKNSARPPLYPWFIAAVTGDAAWSDDDFSHYREPLLQPSAAIIRVVRTQRIVLWSSLLISVWAASLLVSPPLAVLFFFALHRYHMLCPNWESSVMSEPLALSLLLLVVAAFCVIVARRSLWPLPVLAIAFGGLVLTRSAGAFAVILLAVAIVVALIANWPRKWALASALVLMGVAGIAALTALLCNSHARNGVWTLAPLKNWERVAFAIQVAEQADVDDMPDEECRQFLAAALHQQNRRTTSWEEFDLNRNCWEIAYPLAKLMFVDRFSTADFPEQGEHGLALHRYVNGLFSRVADEVLSKHRDRYWRIVTHSFFTRAARDCTQLHWRRISFWWLTGLGFLGCVLGRNSSALAGAACVMAHIGNLLVMSCFELPLDRYVQFSEWLFLFGLLLAGVGCGRRLVTTLIGSKQNNEKQSSASRLAA